MSLPSRLWRSGKNIREKLSYIDEALEDRQEDIWKLESQLKALAEVLGVAFSSDGEKAYRVS